MKGILSMRRADCCQILVIPLSGKVSAVRDDLNFSTMC
jgi:hypothetical protein